MSDIRKWFMKKHDTSTGNGNASNSAKPSASDKPSSKPEKLDGQESSGRRKTSKYFATGKAKEEKEVEELSSKRKAQRDSEELSGHGKPPPGKKAHKAVGDDDDDDFVLPTPGKDPANITPSKKLKSSSGKGVPQKSIDNDNDADDGGSCDGDTKSNLKSSASRRGGKSPSAARTSGRKMDVDESDDDGSDEKDIKTPKPGGRGRGRGAAATPASGRGRGGGGRGGFMNFGERKDPPHKGEKEVPEGAPDCLAGFTFVISGTLDSLEREEAEDLIKRHGGRVTGSVSKKTNYLLCDEDIGGRKSEKAKELGTVFLTEDGLFDMIRASKKSKTTQEPKKPKDEIRPSPKKESLQKPEAKISVATKELTRDTSSAKRKVQSSKDTCLPWPEKYRPKIPDELVGNQALVKQLEEWLVHWDELFLNASKVKGKAKKQNDASAKKAVLLSGTPGIGKTTSAKLISQKLGFQAVEVNASDSRGKADAKIVKGIGGRTSNSIKELVSNESLHAKADRSPHSKIVLIMDEVDGMSGGDRGGVADLIASIKASKIPIICICNDRYSQKLKSLVNYCLLLSFRKPTKQQMAKRLLQIANAEGLQVNQIALEELAERVNGDMRMALNQLQYLSLSKSVINYDDIRQRLQASSKDEDMSPFTAVDKLFGFNAGKLKIDERVGLCMSDPDLVPLIIQENYINYRPSGVKDANGLQRMNLVARAAESIADGDIVNVQIRRYQQWQLSQMGSLASSIIPSALLHGQRETLEQGERNYNRFGGWLGKNSTMGKNYRLLEDLRFHLLASSESILERRSLRLDYMTLLRKKLTDPLRTLAKDEAVETVVDFMDSYSITQDDFDSIMEISKFQGHSNPMDGIQPAVKAALTKAYNKGSSSRVIRTADLITLPGLKKAPKKRVAAMLEPIDENLAEENGDTLQEDEEGNSDAEEDDLLDPEKKVQLNLQNLNSKGIQVDMKGSGSSGKKAPAGRGRGKATSKAAEKSSGSKRKR
ncbi:PREDICTED: replication factor C subunit 1 isoform X2 [Ipomoea nil]|uniref:replication factor C subunit 1 isoform X2 n=1 Tax=Ipomoea nil TaxID=35883 RepID=UPI0009018FC7|nr:PREDICTED: replication factor C subunit 1 isoform X2 [Ipomoea nil]